MPLPSSSTPPTFLAHAGQPLTPGEGGVSGEPVPSPGGHTVHADQEAHAGDVQVQLALMAANGHKPKATRNDRAPRLRAVPPVALVLGEGAGNPPGAGASPGPAHGEGVTQAMVLRELAGIAFFDIRRLFNDDGSLKRVQELDRATAAAIASIEVVEIGPGGQLELGKKFKSPEKLKALDLLGTHLGMFAKKADDASIDPLRKALAQMPAERAEGMLVALEQVKSAKKKPSGAAT